MHPLFDANSAVLMSLYKVIITWAAGFPIKRVFVSFHISTIKIGTNFRDINTHMVFPWAN